MRTERLEFSRTTREDAWLRSQEKCELCCQPLYGRRPEYHHRIEAALGGDNSLRNCVVACPPCHRLITTKQAPVVAKAIRIERKRANLTPKVRGWNKWRPPQRKEESA